MSVRRATFSTCLSPCLHFFLYIFILLSVCLTACLSNSVDVYICFLIGLSLYICLSAYLSVCQPCLSISLLPSSHILITFLSFPSSSSLSFNPFPLFIAAKYFLFLFFRSDKFQQQTISRFVWFMLLFLTN
jgi:hypothetical protein